MGKAKTYTKEMLIEAISGSGGIVTTVAKRLGCMWITARRYIDKWADTRRALLDEEETILDMAEGTIYQAIKDKDTQAAKWLLSTKGKDRGYSDRHEVTGAKGEPLTINVVWTKPDED